MRPRATALGARIKGTLAGRHTHETCVVIWVMWNRPRSDETGPQDDILQYSIAIVWKGLLLHSSFHLGSIELHSSTRREIFFWTTDPPFRKHGVPHGQGLF